MAWEGRWCLLCLPPGLLSRVLRMLLGTVSHIPQGVDIFINVVEYDRIFYTQYSIGVVKPKWNDNLRLVKK
jgi:hypothetical protein